jgi:spore germination protein
VQALVALLLALGPHAAEALAHAQDAPAAWVSAAPLPIRATAATALPKRVYGYLPYWESIDLATYRWDLISEVIAFSVEIGADGSVSNPHALPGAALLSAAHAHGVRVHLCATLFNTSGGSEIATFLASASARSSAIAQLATLAPDGLNLDFEFVPGASRDAFTRFVLQLRAALPPPVELTLAMPATTSYSGYDVQGLAAAADRLLLMEYEYHWRGAPSAGANAPLASVQTAVDAYLARAPAASLAMGVPYYGYEWPTTSTASGASTTAPGTAVLLESVYGKFTAYGRVWDPASQTPWYAVTANGQARQGWVEDGDSLALKYRFARARDLSGVMIWALGYDGARTEGWTALQTAYLPEVPYEPPPARGCSHSGASWLGLAALLGLRRRAGTLPRGAC